MGEEEKGKGTGVLPEGEHQLLNFTVSFTYFLICFSKKTVTVHQEILLDQTFLKMQQVHLVSIYTVSNLIRDREEV